MQAPEENPKLAVQVWQVTVVPEVLHVAQPVAQAAQAAVPPADVCPEGQDVQAPLENPKLTSQVWQVTVVPEVLQVAHPEVQAAQVAVPPAEVCPEGQAVQAPDANPKFAVQVWQVTAVPLLLQVAHPVVQAVQLAVVPPADSVPLAQAEQVPAPELKLKLGLHAEQVSPPAVVQLEHPLLVAVALQVYCAEVSEPKAMSTRSAIVFNFIISNIREHY